MHEIVIKRRHQIKIGDALGGDQRQRMRDVEPAQANESAADERHGEQRAHAHGVIERHDAERALAAGVEILRHMGQRRGALGVLAARHALRPRRGAGGVKHHRPGFGIDARRRHRARTRDASAAKAIVGGGAASSAIRGSFCAAAEPATAAAEASS